jgi:penicillin-binding protein 1C
VTAGRKRIAIAAALAVTIGVAAVAWVATAPPALPDFASVRAQHVSSEAGLLDRHGALLHERRVDPDGRRLAWAALGDVAPLFVETLIGVEDRRFRAHAGVDWLAIAAALRDAIAHGRPRGASTLTMQLAALLDPSLRARQLARRTPNPSTDPDRPFPRSEPTASGEVHEARDEASNQARSPIVPRSEPTASGDFIRLAAKLRQLRAARALERSWSKEQILEAYLNLATFRGELQGIAAASRGLFDRDPHGLGESESALLSALLRAPNASPEAVAARACRVASRHAQGVRCDEIEARATLAFATPPALRPRSSDAPHLAAQLLRDAAHARVATTIDAPLQRVVADVLARQVAALAGRNVRDAAALVVDNASGDVLAYVGGSGALSSARFVDGVRARRQAGSSLKPFLYARALDRRLVTVATRLDDAPLDVATALGNYRPENYDHAFRGPVAVREALASSLNVPAVRLLQMVGVDDFVAMLGQLGFAGLRDAEFYGDSLALGSADVSLWEMVGAYRTLATGGVHGPLRVAMADAPRERRVFSPEAAFLVADVLADRAGRAPTFGLENPLATRFWSAAKTGTSKDMRDNWCVGFTARFTVGVWVGNFSGDSMWSVSGVDGAAPAWLEIVNALHVDLPSEAPSPPPALVRANAEWFLAGTPPAVMAASTHRAAAPQRIVAPQQGDVLVLDPDIPDARERTWIEAATSDPRTTLQIDGRAIGSAAAPRLWPLERGRHELVLVASDGARLDAVSFVVR